MGIEFWALIVLSAVLSLYLLPTLVGRREVMRSARTEDRHSAQLRILSTAAPTSESVCLEGHENARIFQSRPEVRVVDRPTVRSVRSLRVERELAKVRVLHRQSRRRRRRAAERRALVVLALLAVSVVVALVVALTSVPWWNALYAPAGTLLAFVLGRRATLRDWRQDQKERRHIGALTRNLRVLTGEAHRPARGRSTGAEQAAWSAAARHSQQVSSEPDTVETASKARARESAPAVGRGTRVSTKEGDKAQAAPTPRPEPVIETAAPAAGAATKQQPTTPKAAPLQVELTPATPPQGWRPVSVPAPTYTLGGRAPRRVVAEPVAATAGRGLGRVPMRPKAVRSFSLDGIEAEAHEFHPIDLDEVLARRRAAGA